ncbi:hypothetical protein [Streptomyces sp. H27-C3]|uniref:hypothetical protein n=1 Tax=Streptomyces sp. H27-C3 TaxID=3046305 RepID=UPI0024B9AE58|nr:hypothetical protein [Streptomyces sp. H27-C3]MDJ0465254.1 hypothetical protein [Streptomyces sp. H27-C3]
MRRTIARRTAVAVSALSLTLLVGACGADKAKDDAAAGDKGKNGGSAAKALSAAELDKIILAEKDLTAEHKITKATKVDQVAGKRAGTDKAECEPFIDVLAFRPMGTPGATAQRKLVPMPAKAAKDATPEEKMKAAMDVLKGTITSDTIGSYDGKGAEEAFAALRSAGEACAGGFILSDGTDMANKDNTKFTKVAAGPAYTGGDEALTYTLSFDMEGESGKETGSHQVVAVRKGNTLAAFGVLGLTGKAEFPKAIIDAQVAKLG